VSPATRDKVLAAANELGYVYNRGAANLRTKQTRTVGLIVTDITNAFFADITKVIEAVLAEAGYVVLLANTFDDLDRQRALLETFAENRADGVLLVPATGTKPAALRPLDLARTPLVLATRYLAEQAESYVGPDDVLGGRLAAEHLLDHDCRTVAYLGGLSAASAHRDRDRGFRAAAAAASAVVDERWCVDSDTTNSAGYAVARQLLATGQAPDGLLCHTDAIAFGVLRALHDAGRAAPKGCRVLGYDDLDQAPTSVPSLSSVSVDAHELGRLSGHMLLERIRGGDGGRRCITTPRLVLRESCGCSG